MRKFISLLFFFPATLAMFAQNLVPNPGFEQKNDCPKRGGQITLANFWFSPNNSTPDYYNACSPSFDYGTEFNNKGGQVPHSGQAYAGIQVHNMNRNDYYEYIETRLDSALVPDQRYCIRAWVSLGQSKYALNEFGMVFSINEIKSVMPQKLKLPYTPLGNSRALSDSEHWMCIQGVYKAKGGERFITFGDFSTADNFQILRYDNSIDTLFRSAYYFIDDISIELISDGGFCNCNQD